jgi:hypothetical protein
MWNARPLAEFNQSGWIQVDFAPLINYRRKEECQNVAKLVEDIFDQEMSGESIQKIFEEEKEEGDEGWINRFDNSRIYDEEREEYNHDEPVGVLDWQTYQGGTRGSRLCGGDRDRETENSKVCARTRDTRFIQVRVAKVANPTSCLEIKYGALRLVLVEIRCPARYPALLYIVQGAGS